VLVPFVPHMPFVLGFFLFTNMCIVGLLFTVPVFFFSPGSFCAPSP
jgi:hypothetical protein